MAWLPMYLDRPDTDLLLSWLNADEEVAFIVLAERKVRLTEEYKRLRASGQPFTFSNIGGLSPLVEVKNRWVAVRRLDALPDGHYTLWHVPSGPLPLLAGEDQRHDEAAGAPPHVGAALTLAQALGRADGVVQDPWAGWVERCPGADASRPYFGPGHPGIIDLEVQTRHLHYTETEDDLVTVHRRVVDEAMIGLSHFGWIGNYYRSIGSPAHPATERWWKRLRRRVQGVATGVTRAGALHGSRLEVYALPAALAAIRGGMAWADN